ncbi:hypothetical protein C9374_008430 [Naegleria lovaniensis]|uniref:fructose-bisphosphatase n=1 Tax=Naegleria lovaniensis TaxID=51637 RepID=A0AA88GJ35_NAELO|nr:uncharacterized protein C9374_008430 [Naegleria lovaniensis]KAG2378287.1 hypothetical protein C9374_008430 [Naegleria lovaniensis]
MSTYTVTTKIFATLNQSILESFKDDLDAQHDLTIVYDAIQIACKNIAACIRKAPIEDLTGVSGTTNSMGEEVKKLDLIANDYFINSLSKCKRVCAMVSEENGDIILPSCDPSEIQGPYVVCFDPLDGSSNIDVAVPVGSIWCIYKRLQPEKKGCYGSLEDCLQSGSNIVAAGYAMYGSCTMIVNATKRGVNGYTLDPVSGDFVLTHPEMKVPKKGSIYSVNEGNHRTWNESTKEYTLLKKGSDEKKPYSLRYVGSMVADVHRTIIKGGIFMYPADKASPSGKLRLLYECNPMSYIIEKAGGKSIAGLKGCMLDIVPTKIHQREPIYLGSTTDVEEVEQIMKRHGL